MKYVAAILLFISAIMHLASYNPLIGFLNIVVAAVYTYYIIYLPHRRV